eukprot:7771811-Karenia_brevis.AAC.1
MASVWTAMPWPLHQAQSDPQRLGPSAALQREATHSKYVGQANLARAICTRTTISKMSASL